jgi:hypothetical protein
VIGDLLREHVSRRTRAEKQHAELRDRVRQLADDLEEGRLPYTWASDIAAALRALTDQAVL